MIKRIIELIVIASTILFFVSCQDNNQTNDNKTNSQQQNIPVFKETSPNSKNDVLVVYFSANDSVSEDANIIKDYMFADMTELVPVELYTIDDLDITNPNSRINKESTDDDIRPVIANSINSIDKYNWIFLGFPVWQHKMPKIVYTFLEKYNFKDKYIFSFCKNESDEVVLADIRDEIARLTKNSNPFVYPVKYIPDGEFVGNITDWVDWCNPKTEFDEGLLPEVSTHIETEEPDLSEALSINNQ